MNADDLGLDISTSKTYIPKCVNKELMVGMFNHCPESVKDYARALMRQHGWKFYVVDQTRGFCEYNAKIITIPAWVYRKSAGEIVWYISHELAHAYNHMNGTCDSHGPHFMEWLKRICPSDCIHHELSYKPRNAKAAGISQNWDDLLGL